jgi:hypothetical protein
MDVPESYEKFVERALVRQFQLYKADVPDARTMDCITKLALCLITEQGRSATTLAAIAAAHVIVPNYLYDDWIFHGLFMDSIDNCLAGRPTMLGPDLILAAESFLKDV